LGIGDWREVGEALNLSQAPHAGRRPSFTRQPPLAGLRLLESERKPVRVRRFTGEKPGRNHEIRPGHVFLVTGCAGFIGSHLVEALAASGCAVVGVDSFIDNYPRDTKERNLAHCRRSGYVEFAELDLAVAEIEPLVAEVNGVFHLAARPGVRTSWGASYADYTRDNVLSTQRVFEAAAAQGVRVVYASSSSVYGAAESYPVAEHAPLAPLSPYGVTKVAVEALAGAYARSLGLDAVALRYFSVYGPRQRPDMAFARVLHSLAENQPFRLTGSGHQTREFTYVGDVVEATLAAMDRAPGGRAYNVGGGGEISLLEATRLCETILDRRLALVHIAPAAGDPERTGADVSRAWDELGWRPTTSLEEGLIAQARDVKVVEEERPTAWAGSP
jgi:UDP-glucuronate 4-epimerase